MATRNIGRLRPKTNAYSCIIESKVPIRFYWADGNRDFDGIEFGPLDNPTRYELRLIDFVLMQVSGGIIASKVLDYMKKHHANELHNLITEIDAHDLGVPVEFLDAFRGLEESS